MGDKNPKARDKAKKQDEANKSAAKAEHDRKQAPPSPSAPKSKGK